MQMLRVFWDEVVALDPGMAAKDERNMKLCRRGQLTELWMGMGLVRVEEKALAIDQEFASFATMGTPQGGGPGGASRSLAQGERGRLEARLRNRLLGNRDDGPITLSARVGAKCASIAVAQRRLDISR